MGVYIIDSRDNSIKVKIKATASLLLLISRCDFLTTINK